MEKRISSKSVYILLLIALVLFMEAGWLFYLYRTEKKDFQNVVGEFIRNSVTEEVYRIGPEEPPFSFKMRETGGIALKYSTRGKHFRTDSIKEPFKTYLRWIYYDYYSQDWNLDSIAAWFRHFCPWENLNPVFIRRNAAGKIIDRYPADCRKPHWEPDFAPFHLGNLEPDTLTAWFDFPLKHFWLRQRYGLLLSIVPFLLALYFGFLILRREGCRRHNHLLTEKQLIFIHDLKTPFCTNRYIEKRILQHIAKWPAEKIHEKLNVSRHLLLAITDEMTQLITCSANYWGTDTETTGFNLRTMLEEVTTRYRCGQESSRIVLDYRLSNPIIRGDSFHLTHVVGNLLDNALRHAGPEAVVTVTCTNGRRGRIRLSVEDNGPGVPRRLRHKIFQPGFHDGQPDESHGIGLAYIRNTIRQIGGRLRLDSRLGQGSCFTLTFAPGKSRRTTDLHTSPRFYHWFFAVTTVVTLFWAGNLYIADRRAFVTEEFPHINEAVFQNNKEFFKWRQDTNCFRNNFKVGTITITHNGKDTTLSMGTRVNQSYIYRRLFYDLCDTTWQIDSLPSAYQRLSASRRPVIFRRVNATGKTIDRTAPKQQRLFLPVECSLPLGYVEGHRLEVRLAYPWPRLFSQHGVGLFLGLAGLLLASRLCRTVSVMTLQQQAFVRFQHEEVQPFIRTLQPRLREIRYPQTTDPEILSEALNRNLDVYRELLEQINLLLEKFKTLKWD